jgi:hypothetical protein
MAHGLRLLLGDETELVGLRSVRFCPPQVQLRRAQPGERSVVVAPDLTASLQLRDVRSHFRPWNQVQDRAVEEQGAASLKLLTGHCLCGLTRCGHFASRRSPGTGHVPIGVDTESPVLVEPTTLVEGLAICPPRVAPHLVCRVLSGGAAHETVGAPFNPRRHIGRLFISTRLAGVVARPVASNRKGDQGNRCAERRQPTKHFAGELISVAVALGKQAPVSRSALSENSHKSNPPPPSHLAAVRRART